MKKLLIVPIAMMLVTSLQAEVRLPKIFTDNMMLQRDSAIRVWGWANPGEAVTVTLAGKNAASKAGENGQWSVELPLMKQGENLELTVTGQNTIVLKNLIVGDIWLCSGQSNMEMTLGGCLNAEEDIKAADFPKIRRIKFNHVVSGTEQKDAPTTGPWQVCTPQTAGGITAAGFYFAREIQAKTGVPIGILDVNWGGTKIEPWNAPAGMESVAELSDEVTKRKNALAAYTTQLPKHIDAMEKWIASSRSALAKGTELPQTPEVPAHPGGNGWCGMYNAMIHPLVPFPIKGALWYQGESNGAEGESYYDKMRSLIGGWRKVWKQGDFPFYFVQLANYQNPADSPAGGDGWAKLREAQTKALSIPHTGMAVIIDTVPLKEAGNIHPRNKYDVGLRLARWALNRDYGMKDVVVSGPIFKAMKVEGSKVRLSFDHTGSGLMIGSKEGRTPVGENKSGKLQRFAIAGADKKWFWADAVIEQSSVVVSSPEVKEPVAVRYAFSMNPDGANLYNREGLPASPFRTDAW